jgi:hypothetical protein
MPRRDLMLARFDRLVPVIQPNREQVFAWLATAEEIRARTLGRVKPDDVRQSLTRAANRERPARLGCHGALGDEVMGCLLAVRSWLRGPPGGLFHRQGGRHLGSTWSTCCWWRWSDESGRRGAAKLTAVHDEQGAEVVRGRGSHGSAFSVPRRDWLQSGYSVPGLHASSSCRNPGCGIGHTVS